MERRCRQVEKGETKGLAGHYYDIGLVSAYSQGSKGDGWMGGRDFRARFTFPSTVRSFVRSNKRGWLDDGRTFEGALPTCAADSCNLLVARSLSPHWHLSPSLSYSVPHSVVVSCLVLGQNVRVYSQVGMALAHGPTDGGRVGSRGDGGHASWLLRRPLEMRFSQSPSMNLVMWRAVHLFPMK